MEEERVVLMLLLVVCVEVEEEEAVGRIPDRTILPVRPDDERKVLLLLVNDG